MNGVDADRRHLAESESAFGPAAGVSAVGSIINQIAEKLPPVCPGYLPEPLRAAIELTHSGLTGSALERAIEDILKGANL